MLSFRLFVGCVARCVFAVLAIGVAPTVAQSQQPPADPQPSPAASEGTFTLGSYSLFDLDATWTLPRSVELSLGFKNLFDDHYELAGGYPQPGRAFYLKTRVVF
jgi:outer membrane receptor protein involved in Fe transport